MFGRRLVRIPRPRFRRAGAPRAVIRKHRYASYYNFPTGVAGVVDGRVFSANSMFDPDVTGGGHQPLMHDQMAVIYTKYLVIGAKITVTFISATSEGASMVGIRTAKDTTILTNQDQLREHGDCKWKLITGLESGRSVTTVTKKFSPKRFFSVTNLKDESDLQALPNASPARQGYFHVFNAPVDAGSAAACVAQVLITYITLWHKPEALPQS